MKPMPELPDLEIFSSNLHRRLSGKTVSKVEYHKMKRLNCTPQELHDTLVGRKLVRVYREGKGTHFQFEPDTCVGVHLMLKGEFHICPAPDGVKYRVATICFDDCDDALVVADPMALTTMTLGPKPSRVMDALAVTPDGLRTLLRRQPSSLVKVLLMDQDAIAGIGNAYADEILYEARIAPKSLCGRIPDPAVEALAAAIRAVLTDAIEQLRNADPESLKGERRDFLKVHNPALTQTASGYIIQTEDINKRKTCFTEEQVLYV
jgi:formamidopyrimidine-DNA glycosylase